MGEKLQIQMNQVVKEVQEVKNDLDEISTENELDNLPEIKAEYENLEYQEKDILLRMYQSKYTYRSIGGIVTETNLSKDQALNLLAKLESMHYVENTLRKPNIFRWRLTDKGRIVIAEYFDDESSGCGQSF